MSLCASTKLSLPSHLIAGTEKKGPKLDEEEETYTTQESSVISAEWDPNEFESQRKSNPKWSSEKKRKPKRIQDISLIRLDSGTLEEETKRKGGEPEAEKDDWPYESSPCGMFGKSKLASSPAEGFDGEFSHGEPEWENQRSKRSGASGGRSSRDRQRRDRQRRDSERSDNDGANENSEYVSDSDEGSRSEDEGGSGSEHNHSVGERSASEDEGSFTVSPDCSSEEESMRTPAVAKIPQRKKPPTLKRGGQHQVATPSVLKAMKGKEAFSSHDEDDADQGIDPHEFDTPKGIGMNSGTYHGSASRGLNKADLKALSSSDHSTTARREGRLKAATADSLAASRKKDFSFDRSMSSADLKAARKANNSFKGKIDINKTASALMEARRKEMSKNNNKVSPKKNGESNRQLPARAKTMGAPSLGGNKLMSALKVFSDAAEAGANAKVENKTYSSTLNALRSISAATAAEAGKGDLKAAIAQQVQHGGSAWDAGELKAKPKPKMKKTMSLSAAGMEKAMAASSTHATSNEDRRGNLRRAKTANEKSSSRLNYSSHESSHEKLARMRKQKLKDASERSAHTAESTGSNEMENSSGRRPVNIDRRAKSFQQSRSGVSLDSSTEDAGTPHRSPGRRNLESKSPSRRNISDSPRSSPRRNLSRSDSTHSYDASPRKPRGRNVIALLRKSEPVTDNEMMQKGNRQMFHSLMFKTKMGISMDKLRDRVNGIESSSSEAEADDASAASDASGSASSGS